MGTYAFDFPTEQDAVTGSWSAKASVGGAVFEKRLRIETIKPNRLKIDLSFPDGMIMRGKAQSGKLHAEWLQGTTARALEYTVEGLVLKRRHTVQRIRQIHVRRPHQEIHRRQNTHSQRQTGR